MPPRGRADDRSSGPGSQLQRPKDTDQVRQGVPSLLGQPLVPILHGLLKVVAHLADRECVGVPRPC
jgi:hypothetical protein